MNSRSPSSATENLTVEPPSTKVRFWKRPFRIIRANLRVYVIINAAAYGLTLIGFGIGLLFPELNAARADALETDGTGELVRTLYDTPALFALVILLVNVFQLSLLRIVLPSLIVPFLGLPLFAYWAVETGVTLVGTSPVSWVLLIPHSLTVLIELQAYVLLLLGAYLIGRGWLWPRSVGATNRRRGYLLGLKKLGLLALPAFVLLVVGAVWEAYSLRYLIEPLGNWLL
jgi:hypothetical protein